MSRMTPPGPSLCSVKNLLLTSFLICCACRADGGQDFTQLGLEDLMAVQVTGVTRRAEPLGRSPAAVFVLSAEDIRRSGARSIPEALRLVPGLDVARINANSYAISSRGFNSNSSDKLQVLLDGRSVYSPLFSGVFWDVLDTYMPDIDRIEVIRGPGGAVWGANAVNGVINIITKSASDTQGTQVLLAGGTEEKDQASFRSGGRFGDTGRVRFYAQSHDLDGSREPDGSKGPDGQSLHQAGFRMDWGRQESNTYSVSGDLYDGVDQDANGTTPVDGGNLVGHWKRGWQDGAETSAQISLDRYRRNIPAVYFEQRETYSADLQHSLAAISGNLVTLGLSAQLSEDETGGPPKAIIFVPADKSLTTYGGFVQDEIAFGGGRGSLVLGSKVEHNDYTGIEIQPSIRAGWQLNDSLFGWGSVARAVRTPNRVDRDLGFYCAPAFAGTVGCKAGDTLSIGSSNFASEELLAYETGIRWRLNPRLLVELTGFFNDYTKLSSFEGVGINGRYANNFDGQALGTEINASWNMTDSFQLIAFFSYLDLNLTRKAGSADTTTKDMVEGNSPKNQAGLRANWQAAGDVNLSGQLRYVDALPAEQVPAYAELDLRAGWWLRPQIELALVGQNLLQPSHSEFGLPADRLEIERAVLAELRWIWQ